MESVVLLLSFAWASATVFFAPGYILNYFLMQRDQRWSSVGCVSLIGSYAVLVGLCCASILLHIPIRYWKYFYIGCFVLAILFKVKRTLGSRNLPQASERSVYIILLLYGGLLYIKGYAVFQLEDYIHLGIIRRLASPLIPSLTNIYVTPNFAYTYPFPGIHYGYALVAMLSKIDPGFVYSKMRAVWGICSLLSLYAGIELLTRESRLRFPAFLMMVLAAVSGSFALIPGFFWGQLAPTCHASDVAMNVLLPLGILSLVWTINKRTYKSMAIVFYAVASIILIIVHIREAVQLIFYVGSYVFCLCLSYRKLASPAIIRGVVLVVILAFFSWVWSHITLMLSGPLTDILNIKEGQIQQLLRGTKSPILFLPLQSDEFIPYKDTFVKGLLPIASLSLIAYLILSPISRFRQLIAASVCAICVILQSGFLSLIMIHFTYSEILFSSVRFITFFLYLGFVPGLILIYIKTIRHHPMYRMFYFLTPCFILLIFKYNHGETFVNIWIFLICILSTFCVRKQFFTGLTKDVMGQTKNWFLPVFFWVGILISIDHYPNDPDQHGFYRFWPTRQEIHNTESEVFCAQMSPHRRIDPINRGALGAIVEPNNSASPKIPWDVKKELEDLLGPETCLLVNALNSNFLPASTFVQVLGWPLAEYSAFAYINFRQYYDQAFLCARKYGVQPFFNLRETPMEKKNYLNLFKIQYVLFDPIYSDKIAIIMKEIPYEIIFSNMGWVLVRSNMRMTK